MKNMLSWLDLGDTGVYFTQTEEEAKILTEWIKKAKPEDTWNLETGKEDISITRKEIEGYDYYKDTERNKRDRVYREFFLRETGTLIHTYGLIVQSLIWAIFSTLLSGGAKPLLEVLRVSILTVFSLGGIMSVVIGVIYSIGTYSIVDFYYATPNKVTVDSWIIQIMIIIVVIIGLLNMT